MQLSKFEDLALDVLAQAAVVLCGAAVLTIAALQLPVLLLRRK